jgi:hypothetical protein
MCRVYGLIFTPETHHTDLGHSVPSFLQICCNTTFRPPTPSFSTPFAAACSMSALPALPIACHRFSPEAVRVVPRPFFRTFRRSLRYSLRVRALQCECIFIFILDATTSSATGDGLLKSRHGNTRMTHDSARSEKQKQILFPHTLSPNSINEFILLRLDKSVRCRPKGAPAPPRHCNKPVWSPQHNPQSIRHGHQLLLKEGRWQGKKRSQQRCVAYAAAAR